MHTAGVAPGTRGALAVTPRSPGPWQPSCSSDDDDYAVYSGTLGQFTSHTPALCSTGGATTADLSMPNNGRYYLVVPIDGAEEGSYGQDSNGAERHPGLTTCGAQHIANCP